MRPFSVAALDELKIGDHLDKYLQADDNKGSCTVMHAVLGGIHLYVYPPSESLNRNFFTIVTMGVSGTLMNVPERFGPEEERNNQMGRCELMCYLPPDWTIPSSLGAGSKANEDDSWPFDLLRSLGGYIIDTKNWMFYDHGIPNLMSDPVGQPFAPSTELCSVVTLEPAMEKEGFCPFQCGEQRVNFLLVVPITAKEAQWKRDVGVEASIYHMVGERAVNGEIPCDYVIDAKRKCCVEAGYRAKIEKRMARKRNSREGSDEEWDSSASDDKEINEKKSSGAAN